MAAEDLARVAKLDPGNGQASSLKAWLQLQQSKAKRSEAQTFSKMFNGAG